MLAKDPVWLCPLADPCYITTPLSQSLEREETCPRSHKNVVAVWG